MTKFRRLWRDRLSDYVRGVVWSPVGTQLAAVSAAGELVLWSEAHLRQPLRRELHGRTELSLDTVGIAASGQYLAAAGQTGQLMVWDLGTDVPGVVFERSYPGVWLDRLAWAPQGDRVAIAVKNQVHLFDLSTQTQTATLDFQASTVLGLAWHPRGQYLAVCGHGSVKIWDCLTWEQVPTSLEVPGASLAVAWSAEGQYLASGNLDRTMSVLEWGQPPPWLMQGFPGKVVQVVWVGQTNPQLAAVCADGITVWRREGSDWQPQVLTGHQDRVVVIAASARARRWASGGQQGTVLLWQQAQRWGQPLKGLKQGTACLAWHPDGQTLAGGGMDGELVVWGAEATTKGFG